MKERESFYHHYCEYAKIYGVNDISELPKL